MPSKNLGLVALILALFSGCTKPIDSGIIINKTYEPQRGYVEKSTHFIHIGKRYIPVIDTHDMVDDEDYVLTFQQTVDGKLKSRSVYVTGDVYNSFSMGDIFDALKVPHEDFDPDYRKR